MGAHQTRDTIQSDVRRHRSWFKRRHTIKLHGGGFHTFQAITEEQLSTILRNRFGEMFGETRSIFGKIHLPTNDPPQPELHPAVSHLPTTNVLLPTNDKVGAFHNVVPAPSLTPCFTVITILQLTPYDTIS